MGLFGFLRRKDQDAIPKPGTPEFEAAVRGSAIPDSQSVAMGEAGWTSTSSSDAQIEHSSQTIDLRGTARGGREGPPRARHRSGPEGSDDRCLERARTP